jgi:type I restriction enzyme S subunit
MTPEGWTRRRLADIATYRAGRTPARANATYWSDTDSGVPWVAISDMTDFGLVTRTKEKISQQAFDSVFGLRAVPAGTLLMSFKLTIGRVATLGVDACHNEAIIAIYPKPGVDQRFLGYFLSRVDYDALQDRQIKGNTLNQEKIDRIEIWLPPPGEQIQIADILDLLRRAISIQDRAIEVGLELKRSTMHALFTRGLREEEQKATAIGLMPSSWRLELCEEVVRDITVGVVVRPASYYVSNGIPAFRSLNVRQDQLDPSNLVYFSKADNDTILAKSKLSAGDVLIVRTGYPGTACVVPDSYDGANCIDLVIVRPNRDRLSGQFLSRFLNSEAGRSQALSNSHGLAQQHLNVGAVRRIQMPVPSTVDEQQEIVSILDAIDRKIELHRRKRTLLKDFFQSLGHELMTGEIRVDQFEPSRPSSVVPKETAT